MVNLKPTNKPEVEISFPHDGDVFHQNSEILFQVRNFSSSEIQYFVDGKVVSRYLSSLSQGKHEIFAEFSQNWIKKRTASIYIEIE
jgi:hypothetical protein